MRRFARGRRFRRTIAGPFSREGTRYSVTFGEAVGLWANFTTLVPPIETQGNRKVKNILCSIGLRSVSYPICYTIFYLPQNTPPTGFLGNTASSWDFAANTWVGNWSSTYDPNQNVLTSGIVTTASMAKVYWSGLRTLNSGDRIVLGFHNMVPDADKEPDAAAVVDVRYSIAYS